MVAELTVEVETRGAGSASDSKGKNASNKGKDSRATLNSNYEKWLLELLKE